MKKSMLILICVLLCMFAFTAGTSAALPDVLPASNYPSGVVQPFNVAPNDDTTYSKYVNSIQMLANQILSTIKYQNKIKEINYNVDEYIIKPNEKPYLHYTFIKKTKIEKVDNNYINKLFFTQQL